MRFIAVSRSLENLSSRQLEAARQASTGIRINAPSTDPVGASELLRVDSALARTRGYQETIKTARGDLELTEGTLDEAGTLLQRVREIAMQGSNGSLDASGRAMLADEIAQLREHLIGLANTKGSNGYVLAGNRTDTSPFSATGAFSGDDGIHRVEIGDGVTSRINVSGAQAFTAAGGTDVFATLDGLETALRANDSTAVAATLTGIDASHSQVLNARADAGLLLNRLDTAGSALDHSALVLAARHSDVGDADALEAFTNLSAVTSSIEQAIAVARTTLNTELNRFR
jgi:flagellar hook-associated protein 3 FlgL